MLQQILADQNLMFFLFHAFLIGGLMGYFIASRTTQNFKKKLKSQSKAYEELMNSLETSAPEKKHGGNYMEIIHMNQYPKKVSGMAY
jgi:hypothetical protein